MKKPKIAMAMSGGVDSSAAAALLLEQGYDVVGFSMQLWNQHPTAPGNHSTSGKPRFGSCCSLDDLHDARHVAGQLSIPYYVVNFEKDFLHKVVQPFVNTYMEGQTPSPCVLCNTHLKFDRLMTFSKQLNADYVATGHYARVEYDHGTRRYQLLKGIDPLKDQSYFLFELKQDQLSRAKLPLGGLSKKEVRRLAKLSGLTVADKPESQEICFVGGKYSDFIDEYLAQNQSGVESRSEDSSGEIVNEEGEVLGKHGGVHRFTIGQRRGLGIATPQPLYVIDIDAAANKVTVGFVDKLKQRHLVARDPNWIAIESLSQPIQVAVKIRSRAPEAPATLFPLPCGRVQVEFEEPVKAVTPGQAVVFYLQDRVLGGGWIDSN